MDGGLSTGFGHEGFQAAAPPPSAPDGIGHGFGGRGERAAATAAAALRGMGLASARNGVRFGPDGIPQGAVDKLRDMYANHLFNRKMDWFDPAWLQDLARRVGDLEATVRSLKKNGKPPQDLGPSRPMGGGKDYDKMIMKLGRDINNLRKQLNDALGGLMPGGSRVPDGDHAMLSGKPLFGYRCMACDRPLEKLDERPGPYVPANIMPVNVAPYERRSLGMPVDESSPPKPLYEIKPSHEQAAARGARGASDGRGPQNWYTDAHGRPAASLPKNDVGPHLPRGGWRGNETAGSTTGHSHSATGHGRHPSWGAGSQAESAAGRLPQLAPPEAQHPSTNTAIAPDEVRSGNTAEASSTSLPDISG
uniref:Flagellar associated protein n=1 Tax=Tetraselmis sp. GSL018 TaxID=582737 RepID=A0A061R2V6_9CHLO